MKTILTDTTPKQAFKMFQQTFDAKQLPTMLDDAFITFTNVMSSLRSTDINQIIDYANQQKTATSLDVLAVCHIYQKTTVLYALLLDLKEDLAMHQHNIRKAKHQRDIMGDIFCNDLHHAYTQTINKHQRLYNQTRDNVYKVEAMICLIKELKK